MANKIVSGQQCFFSFPTLTWYPGKVSTFIFPVIEIEQMIAQLTVLRDKTIALSQFPTSAPITAPPISSKNKPSITLSTLELNDYQKINASIENWNTILRTYRQQTGDLTYGFTNEMQQYNSIVNSFYDFQSKQDKATNAARSVDKAIKTLTSIAQKVSLFTRLAGNNPFLAVEIGVRIVQEIIFSKLQGTIRNLCNDMYVRNQKQFRSYGTHICQDFHDDRWTTFTNFFKDACSINTGFDSGSDFKQFYGQVCMKGQAIDQNKYPGGVEKSDVDQTLFHFLQSNKAYLTFGSQAPVSLKWTTSVSNSLTHTTSFYDSYDYGITVGGKNELSAGIKLDSTAEFSLATSYNINVGQGSTSTESTQRTVVINLGDSDQGNTHFIILTVSFCILLLFV